MAHLDVIRGIRRKLAIEGPPWVRAANDFATVTLPERDCDAIRDLLVAERPGTVIEIGLAYGSSALAIGEALISVGGDRHVILDPFQDSGFRDAGWDVIRSAQLDGVATLLRERSQIALPRLAAEGMSADAAFVDGSHVFHNVFVDLYYLQMIVRPGGLVVLDDHCWPGYGGSLFRDQSGLATASACEHHAGTTACAAVARSAGGARIQGVDAVLAQSMIVAERLLDRRSEVRLARG